jgi:DNA/RNA-binding domain of Phe-tRNA-synthetase-like protein
MTSQMTSIINGENEKIDLETVEQIWDMPVVQIWADILALFEGKGRSGSSSFWSMMCAAVKSVNPKIKGLAKKLKQ